jgi:hypothetical protein
MNVHAGQSAFFVGLLAYFAVRGRFQRLVGDASAKARRSSPADRSLIALAVHRPGRPSGALCLQPVAQRLQLHHAARLRAGGSVDRRRWRVAVLAFASRSRHELVRHVGGPSGPSGRDSRRVRGCAPSHVRVVPAHGVAQVLLLPNWIAGFSALVAVALLCIVRVPRDESMMCEFFGDEYRHYMRRTGRVVPRAFPRRVACEPTRGDI